MVVEYILIFNLMLKSGQVVEEENMVEMEHLVQRVLVEKQLVLEIVQQVHIQHVDQVLHR